MKQVHIIDGGVHVTHDQSFHMRRPKGVAEYLLLLIKTPAIFMLDQTKKHVEPQTILLIDRYTPYEYYNPEGAYIDDWLHFEATGSSRFKSLLNQLIPCQNSRQVEIYLQQILWEKEYAPDHFKAENVQALFDILINNLLDLYEQGDDSYQNNPYYYTFRQLRLNIQFDPSLALSAKEVAETIGISVSHFHHLYKEFFQIPYASEVIRFRIEQAKRLLTTTALTVAEISQVCGYTSEIHFYRQFKKVVHVTPKEFRQKAKI